MTQTRNSGIEIATVTNPLELSGKGQSPRALGACARDRLAVVGGLLFFGIRSRVKAETNVARGDGTDGSAFGFSRAAEADNARPRRLSCPATYSHSSLLRFTRAPMAT